MLIKFANAEVDVWKLRSGVVLGKLEGNYTVFMHLVGFENYYAFGHELKLYVLEDGEHTEYYPNELIWLET